ncbi:papain-like cysteine protease family protein [Roseomonas harenae]|uniref:papain-like cysteine protease family protein n=1 Tax=Muricoccus harenae TaxID=2692566 RepID=UPI001331362D|nr:papain-like cysteine protease family protein [Roseomonas harenae]
MALAPQKDDVVLQVPMMKQSKEMSCWLAAAQMLLAYRSATSMITDTNSIASLNRYFLNKGLSAALVQDFANECGLNSRPSNILLSQRDKKDYANTLLRCGPLWVWIYAGNNQRGGHHIIVVNGIVTTASGPQVMVNDPSDPSWADSYPLADFNNRAQWFVPILYKLSAGTF